MHTVTLQDRQYSASDLTYFATAALFLVFLAAHLPFLPASLEDLDSINFALGVRRFDVAHHQPHPPGYPVYVAVAKLAHAIVPSDPASSLAVVSVLAGAVGVFALVALFRRIDSELPRRWPEAAAFLTATSPLYWFTAARPLSDIPGLSASVAVQAFTLGATSDARLLAAGFLAGVAAGIRAQVAWLTVPLLLLAVVRHPGRRPVTFRLGVLAAFLAGVAVWGVPLVLLSGGPRAYGTALFSQGAEDLTGVQMLTTTPTLRQLWVFVYFAFVGPWATMQMAAGILIVAAWGAVVMYRRSRIALATLAAAFVPYFLFDALLQEALTTRYALPLVVPVAYLAVRGATALPRPIAMKLVLGAGAFNAIVAITSVAAYSSMAAPAFRMLADMRVAELAAGGAPAPVLAMHRREDLDLRRPIQWVGDSAPSFAQRLPARPKHEWLEVVKYWNSGGRAPVWFVGDPRRSDLALIDHPSSGRESYVWPLLYPALMGGVRPDEMDWLVLDSPGWYLGEGWALTPETAGVADEDRRGPGLAPVEGWIRRRPEPATLMLGGRNLAADGSTARVGLAIDGRSIVDAAVLPGFFVRTLRLPAGALDGNGDYARMSVTADRPGVAIEQFDVQSAGRVVFGFDEGWHEREYDPATGRLWRWMSERGAIRVDPGGHALRLILSGATGRFPTATIVTVKVNGHPVGQFTVGRRFTLQTAIPSDLLGAQEGRIVIEANQFFVPAERRWLSRDRRHLALQVFDFQLRPVS